MADQLVLICFVDVQWIESVFFEICVAIELEICTCNHLHACQPVNLLSVVTPAIKSKLWCLLYWSMLCAGWNVSSKNMLLDMVIEKYMYKDKK